MTKRRKNLGKLGENLAKKALLKKGYKFITQNFSCRLGEIDLVFKDKDTLVFVEVKTRYSEDDCLPEEAVTPRKISSIKKAGQYFKITNPGLPDPLRIDVVAIELNPVGFKLKALRHFKNITG